MIKKGMTQLSEKIWNKFRRLEASICAKRLCTMNSTIPFISFTFDDFPINAYTIGGKILKNAGLRGTYYISLGLLNKILSAGKIADQYILRSVVLDGHELGCHTYSHTDAWNSKSDIFEESIVKNKHALQAILPQADFRTFAYPIGNATKLAKRTVEKYFVCARGGRQTFNKDTIDLNNLNAYFLDSRKNLTLSSVKEIIDRNSSENGWLIFTTHDVDANPTPYGCNINFFEEVVRYSSNSGSSILPVVKVYEKIIEQNNRIIK